MPLRLHLLGVVLRTYVENNFDMAREKETIQFLGDVEVCKYCLFLVLFIINIVIVDIIIIWFR